MFLTGLGISVFLGGTSLLIVVSVTMDTVQQVQSHLFAQQYEGLIQKSKLRGAKSGARGGTPGGGRGGRKTGRRKK